MRTISQIRLTLYNDGNYRVTIAHCGVSVESGAYKNACDAYADAENKLIYKPGHVMAVPIDER